MTLLVVLAVHFVEIVVDISGSAGQDETVYS